MKDSKSDKKIPESSSPIIRTIRKVVRKARNDKTTK